MEKYSYEFKSQYGGSFAKAEIDPGFTNNKLRRLILYPRPLISIINVDAKEIIGIYEHKYGAPDCSVTYKENNAGEYSNYLWVDGNRMIEIHVKEKGEWITINYSDMSNTETDTIESKETKENLDKAAKGSFILK